jgi:PAS domain S-box-containing protein
MTGDAPTEPNSSEADASAQLDARIRRHDWSAEGLGPVDGWPGQLKTLLGVMLGSKQPMFVVWGDKQSLIYNDSYAEILADKHPGALGKPFLEVWSELRADIAPIVEQAYAGQPVHMDDIELVMHRRGYPEEAHFAFSYTPILGDERSVLGFFCVCAEITGQVFAERALKQETARQRRLFEQAPGFITILAGPHHTFEFVNQAYRKLFGQRDYVGREVREVFPELAGQGFFEMLDQVWLTQERIVATGIPARLDLDDGEVREVFLDFIYEPVTNPNGEITGIFCEGHDVTEPRRATAALRESEEQLRLATEAAEVGLWDLDLVHDSLFWPPRVKAMFGISPDVPVSMADFYDGLHPEDRERTSAAFDAATDPDERAVYDVEYRTIGKEDGLVRWVAAKGRAIFNAQGLCTRVVGTAMDITARKRADEHLRLMVLELNHRVKNNLATVQSIAAQTLRGTESLPAARTAFLDRITALAAAHDILTREQWDGAGPLEIARGVLEALTGADGRVSMQGPKLVLTPRTALALSMALHELGTNALKYGALSQPTGHVELRWSVAGGELLLSWVERGGPPVKAPERRGFGSRLLERGLAAELNGSVELDYRPTGLECSIRAALNASRETWTESYRVLA